MATKTFKIGEYCKGGIIQAIATKDKIIVIGKDWDFSQGSKKGSNQTNAKEWTRLEVNPNDSDTERELSNFLNDLTSSYYADKVIDYIKKHTTFFNGYSW